MNLCYNLKKKGNLLPVSKNKNKKTGYVYYSNFTEKALPLQYFRTAEVMKNTPTTN